MTRSIKPGDRVFYASPCIWHMDDQGTVMGDEPGSGNLWVEWDTGEVDALIDETDHLNIGTFNDTQFYTDSDGYERELFHSVIRCQLPVLHKE